VRVTQKGQVTITLEVRRALGIRPGSDVDFQLDERGARLVVERDRAARPVRARSRRAGSHEVRVERPRAGVVQARARGRAPLRRIVAVEHPRPVGVPEEQVRGRQAQVARRLADRLQACAAQGVGADVAAHGPDAGAVDGAHGEPE